MLSSFTHIGTPLYPYTPNLLALASHINPAPPPLPPLITSPLNYDAWQLWLDYHPDQHYALYILHGIAHGFRIGFDHTNTALRSASTNYPSAIEHPEIIKNPSLPKPAHSDLLARLTQHSTHTSTQAALALYLKNTQKKAPDIGPIAPQIPQH